MLQYIVRVSICSDINRCLKVGATSPIRPPVDRRNFPRRSWEIGWLALVALSMFRVCVSFLFPSLSSVSLGACSQLKSPPPIFGATCVGVDTTARNISGSTDCEFVSIECRIRHYFRSIQIFLFSTNFAREMERKKLGLFYRSCTFLRHFQMVTIVVLR